MKWILAIFAVLLIGCQTMDLDTTHPVTDTMGCSPEEILEDGTCVSHSLDSNAEVFGPLDLTSLYTEELPELPGYLARPVADGLYPGIVMIHEWWGLNDNIRTMANQLAQEGYVVLAVDLYGGEVADESSKAGALAGAVRNNPEQAVETMKKASAYLREEQDITTLGSLGWCFGGGQSLNLATSGEQLDATVIYYGQLTDEKSSLERISWPILGIFAEEDSSIPPTAVKQFKDVLDELSIDNEIYIYEGVGHAFANPSGARFAPAQTKDAWEKTLIFLEENLKS